METSSIAVNLNTIRRGVVFVRLEKWEKAKEDLTTARDKQENIIIEQFRKEYENVAEFEQKHEIKLPENIAALLTPPQA